MTSKRIVYTCHDGSVSVCIPTDWAIKALASGGFWGARPRGWYDRQVESQVARGVLPDAASRYVRAMITGGCTTAEALAIIRDRDCAHLGTQIELQDASDLPADRWFRNAWSRSANGGPIGVNLELARPIQWQKARDAVAAANKQRAESFVAQGPIEPDWGTIRQAITNARDEKELRAIWPKGVA